MLWLVDECVAPEIVHTLRSGGHDVVSVLEQFRASRDTFIIALAAQQGRILLTEDTGFGELVFRDAPRPGLAGVVLIRMPTERQSLKLARLNETIEQYGDQLLGNYIVIGETRSRIRALPDK